MERAQEHNPLWFCVWNKRRLPEAPDELRCGLLDGMELLGWIDQHRNWFRVGKWDDARYARPIRLTKLGKEALLSRALYDMEPVYSGLCEPGLVTIPAELEEIAR